MGQTREEEAGNEREGKNMKKNKREGEKKQKIK